MKTLGLILLLAATSAFATVQAYDDLAFPRIQGYLEGNGNPATNISDMNAQTLSGPCTNVLNAAIAAVKVFATNAANLQGTATTSLQVSTPIASGNPATKAYVDSVVAGAATTNFDSINLTNSITSQSSVPLIGPYGWELHLQPDKVFFYNSLGGGFPISMYSNNLVELNGDAKVFGNLNIVSNLTFGSGATLMDDGTGNLKTLAGFSAGGMIASHGVQTDPDGNGFNFVAGNNTGTYELFKIKVATDPDSGGFQVIDQSGDYAWNHDVSDSEDVFQLSQLRATSFSGIGTSVTHLNPNNIDGVLTNSTTGSAGSLSSPLAASGVNFYRAGSVAVAFVGTGSTNITFSTPFPNGATYEVSLPPQSSVSAAPVAYPSAKTTNGFTINVVGTLSTTLGWIAQQDK